MNKRVLHRKAFSQTKPTHLICFISVLFPHSPAPLQNVQLFFTLPFKLISTFPPFSPNFTAFQLIVLHQPSKSNLMVLSSFSCASRMRLSICRLCLICFFSSSLWQSPILANEILAAKGKG